MPKAARASILTLAALTLAACGAFGTPDGATEEGRDIRTLWNLFVVAGLVVAGIVYALIGWSVIRYRNRGRDDEPPQFHTNLVAEAFYVGIPIILVVVLFVFTFRTEQRVTSLQAEQPLTIAVTAFKWSWAFDYPNGVTVLGTPQDPPEMWAPVGEPVRIVLSSSDVIHSFYVPEFLFKRDAIPGRTTEFEFTIEEPGRYISRCAEFCGLDHARMIFHVRAVPAAEFERWLAEEAA